MPDLLDLDGMHTDIARVPSILLLSEDTTLVTQLSTFLREAARIEDIEIGNRLDWLTARLASRKVTLLIIDGRMHDALPALRLTKNQHARQRILFLSPHAQAMQQAFASDVDDCLPLPLHGSEAIVRLQRLLDAVYPDDDDADMASQFQHGLKVIGHDMGLDEAHMLARFDRIACFHDPATAAHERRVGRYAGLLARVAGCTEEESNALERAAPLHDIGKIGIAASLLNKDEKLSAAERAFLYSHTDMGYEILTIGTRPLLRLAAVIARSHHERFDGSGYPQCLSGERIPYPARIVALADVYDALASPRPYKPAWDADTVGRFVRENSGSHFDPQLVDVFTRHGEAFRALQTELSLADS